MTGKETSATPLRLGIYILQDAPLEVLVQRWRRSEELGFDAAYVADHTTDYRNPGSFWLDGWTVLTHVASHTERIRIGTLVTNPLLHHPAQLARQAAAVDRLSEGRLELGVGTAIAGFDHAAVGEPYWPPGERAQRFAEYVEVLDDVLRTKSGSCEHAGRFFRTRSTPLNPGSLQQPRPPITVGGQSPTVLRVAARIGDCWNTHGPFGRSVDEIAQLTAAQNQRVDELCAEAGRRPSSVRRSLLLFDALDAWASEDRFEKIVHLFRQVGMHEFVVFWPPPSAMHLLEQAADIIAALRQEEGT